MSEHARPQVENQVLGHFLKEWKVWREDVHLMHCPQPDPSVFFLVVRVTRTTRYQRGQISLGNPFDRILRGEDHHFSLPLFPEVGVALQGCEICRDTSPCFCSGQASCSGVGGRGSSNFLKKACGHTLAGLTINTE